jgi:hypothetical protein
MNAEPINFGAEAFIRDSLDPISRQFGPNGGERLQVFVANLAAAAAVGEAELLPKDRQQSRSALWSMLALEAVFWTRLGVDDGSLPENTGTMAGQRDGFWTTAAQLAEEFGEALTVGPSGVDILRRFHTDFFTSATISSEALTGEHLEFLRLIHFAPDTEWQLRLGDVGLLLETASQAVAQGLATDVVDRVSWVLTGTPEDAFTFLPSHWRWWWIQEPNHSALRQRSGSRWVDLRRLVADLPSVLQPLWLAPPVDAMAPLRAHTERREN